MYRTLRPRCSSQKSNTTASQRYWKEDEHDRFLEAGYLYGFHNAAAIAAAVGTRTRIQVRTHAQKWLLRTGQRCVREPNVRAAVQSSLHPVPQPICPQPTIALSFLYCDESLSDDDDNNNNTAHSNDAWTTEALSLFTYSSDASTPQKEWPLEDWESYEPFFQLTE